MANEINIQATLTVQRSTQSVQGSGTLPITQGASGKSALTQVSLGTTSALFTLLAPTVNVGYVMIKNIGANYVEIGLTADANFFAKLRPNEFMLVPLKDGLSQLWGKANTAATNVVIVAAEP